MGEKFSSLFRRKDSNLKAISFVVPIYNAEDTVEESLDSIVRGNFKKGDELLLVDDCSTDSSLKVLKGYQAKHPSTNIKIIRHIVNKGDGAARNTAIELCRHEYIFCLDADNVLVPDSIRPLLKKMLAKGADVASFQELHYFKSDTSKVELKWHYPSVKYDLAYQLSHHKLPCESGNYLITRTAWAKYGRYPEYAGALNNWGFGLAQAAGGANIIILEDSFYFHRYGHESLWLRDEHAGKIPFIALQLLLPYIELIDQRDVDYIFSKRGRQHWFSQLDKRPIRLKR
ncbi:MAG: glycosyltransferase family 2 protein [Candidatus Saccharimonadales bacterium]